ncbi:MAG TPA: hypothetical protein DDW91_12780, partial [Shewanella frigidimarina]|nr:hypothetical protein [Shewanella frigidimarina]
KLPAPPQAAQTLESANIIITKNEPAQILSQFLKKLESTPLPIIDNAVKGSDVQQKTPNELTPSSAKVGQDSTAVKTLTPVTQQQSSSGLSAESNLAKTGSNMEQQANLAKSAVNNTVEQTALPTKSVAEQNTPKA